MYGVGILVAIGAGLLLGTVLLDYLLNLLPIPRIILMLAALGVSGEFSGAMGDPAGDDPAAAFGCGGETRARIS